MAKKVAFEFDPFRDVDVPRKNRVDARAEISDFVKEEVLSLIGSGKSPVKGGAWTRKLTAGYLKQKKKFSSVRFANLERKGDMLDTFDVKESGARLTAQVAGKEAAKAEGHNTGVYGKNATNKKREFIPKEGQTFTDAIWAGINKIARRFE